jgi:hypothetical protein
MEIEITDAAAATAFRRLVAHLQHRHDAENIDLMGLAGFCRNCLADWVMEADGTLTKDEARSFTACQLPSGKQNIRSMRRPNNCNA